MGTTRATATATAAPSRRSLACERAHHDQNHNQG